MALSSYVHILMPVESWRNRFRTVNLPHSLSFGLLLLLLIHKEHRPETLHGYPPSDMLLNPQSCTPKPTALQSQCSSALLQMCRHSNTPTNRRCSPSSTRRIDTSTCSSTRGTAPDSGFPNVTAILKRDISQGPCLQCHTHFPAHH